ncbi:glycosyl hydrolase family 5 [Methylovorus menthalis]|uniref:glycosyl hydrolase family 8 n=1 Tax=Methylovorus menthalis TaxID=1002227 RepID=UPI001E428933|nr:glycosyl hydrolase family 8 [Methylovorus menthalis]MCB4810158.1 glycosyl hydrolase family 5 [Methylovorus menthalis]
MFKTDRPLSYFKALLLGFLFQFGSASATAGQAEWTEFKQRFVLAEGRVVDVGNGGISHSEGQGVTMLLAVHYNDQKTFDRLWQWTQTSLQVRKDHLLAWRWTTKHGVNDFNNATDGDLYVAWALLRASDKWHVPAYKAAAEAILNDVKRLLVKPSKWGPVILPGSAGFEKPAGQIVNLSYWVFPALNDFSRYAPDPVWDQLGQSGITLIGESHFGKWQLPTDWVQLGNKVIPAPGFPAQFGYDAVRVPLFIMWGKKASASVLAPFQAFWGHYQKTPYVPPTVSIENDAIAPYGAASGILNIADMTCRYPALQIRPEYPINTQDYYSATLLLLADMMVEEQSR